MNCYEEKPGWVEIEWVEAQPGDIAYGNFKEFPVVADPYINSKSDVRVKVDDCLYPTSRMRRLGFAFFRKTPNKRLPTGIGAVIRDSDGNVFTRVQVDNGKDDVDNWAALGCNLWFTNYEVGKYGFKVLSEGIEL